jgi:hypothetical protein
MEHMRKLIFSCLLFISVSGNAQVHKIDHFFASSPKADTLFNLFKSKFELPIEWDYKTYGNFSSGAVTLGNVAFEFVNSKGVSKTKFEGIALLPQQTVEEISIMLDNAKVNHDTIEPNTYMMGNGSIAGWSNMGLKSLLPDDISFFIYDYKNRLQLTQSIKKTHDSLTSKNGGPLGIVSLKEIVIGSNKSSSYKNELGKLPGVNLSDNDLFIFAEGPSIRLVNSNSNGIEKIIIKVHSIDIAKKYLKSQNLIGDSTKNSVFINTAVIYGLLIEFTEQ